MTRLLTSAATAALMAAALAAPAAAQNFAVIGATVATGDGSEPMENATVVVRDGKIAAVGTDLMVTMDMPTIDGRGKWVTPGLFATLTDLGIYDVDAVGQSNDIRANQSEFSAALDIAPVINANNQQIRINRSGGVTRATVAPRFGRSIFTGQGAVIDLGSDPKAVTQARAFQFVEFGETGAWLAGGSRAATHIEFRNALAEAEALASTAGREDDSLLNRPDAAALIPVVKGQQPLYVHVERAADIRAMLALKAEMPQLDLVIVGASEGWMVASEIAASGIPVLAVALNDLPAQFEQLAATQSNVGRMTQAGVKVGIGLFYDMNHPRYAPQQAGNLVALNKLPGATGLSWAQAMAAITSIPAEISGVGGTQGVLAPGAAGDVVIWDGDPLELSSAPLRVFIDGVEQPLDNHQSRLKDRYATPEPGDLPKAYDW